MRNRNKRIKLALIVAVLIGCYLSCSPLFLARFLLYKPVQGDYDSVPAKLFGAERESVAFKAPSGNQICGLYFQKPNSKYVVLLNHGQGGNITTHIGLAKTILQAGQSVLIYDYEGFGMSSGTASNQNMLDDGIAAYDFLVSKKQVDPSTIVQCGVSLGTGIASHTSEHKPCAAVILISPYTSLYQVAVERIPQYKLYPKFLFPHPDLGALAFIHANKNIPVLMIHGADDPIINYRHAEVLDKIAKCPHSLVIQPNVHHGDFSTTFLSNEIKSFLQSVDTKQK